MNLKGLVLGLGLAAASPAAAQEYTLVHSHDRLEYLTEQLEREFTQVARRRPADIKRLTDVFTKCNRDEECFYDKATGELIKRERIWPGETAYRARPSEDRACALLERELPKKERKALKTRWEALERKLEQPSRTHGKRDVTFHTGHASDLGCVGPRNGRALLQFRRIYFWQDNAPELFVHCITESTLRAGIVSSAHAEGLCQILDKHESDIRRFFTENKVDVRYDSFDPFQNAAVSGAVNNVMRKRLGSSMVVLSRFHAGRHVNFAIELGRRILDANGASIEAKLIDEYLVGIPAQLELWQNKRLRNAYDARFGPASAEYVASAYANREVMRTLLEMPQDDVHVYKVLRTPTKKESQSLRDSLPASMNRHRIERNSFVYSTTPLSSPGLLRAEKPFWYTMTPKLAQVWQEWRALKPEQYTREKGKEFSRKFVTAGDPWMGWAVQSGAFAFDDLDTTKTQKKYFSDSRVLAKIRSYADK